VLGVHFAKKIIFVKEIIHDEDFLSTLMQQFTGRGFVPQYNRTVIYNTNIFVFLNSFNNKRLKLKSSDFMSDIDKCINSKPNNNTGMHFEKTSCKVNYSGAVRPTFPKMALTERKNDFLCSCVVHLKCRDCTK